MTTTLTLHNVVPRPVFAERPVTAPCVQFRWMQGLVEAARADRDDALTVHDGAMRQGDRGVDLPTLFEVLSRIPG